MCWLFFGEHLTYYFRGRFNRFLAKLILVELLVTVHQVQCGPCILFSRVEFCFNFRNIRHITYSRLVVFEHDGDTRPVIDSQIAACIALQPRAVNSRVEVACVQTPQLFCFLPLVENVFLVFVRWIQGF